MCKRRRNLNNCDCFENRSEFKGCTNEVGVDRGNLRRGFFPKSIRDLLILLAEEDDDNRVTIIIGGGFGEESILEDVRIIAVLDNTLVANCHDMFRFIDICCICQVIVDCHTILGELFEMHNVNRS